MLAHQRRQSKLANVKQKKKKSFTLVEVVFTISIIGILMSILLPAMNSAKLAAKKVKDVSNLQKIAEAWRECAINRGWTIDGGKSSGTPKVTIFAEQLAGQGKTSISDMVLNDASVYFSPGDKYSSKILKETPCKIQGNTITLSWAITGVTNFMASSTGILSYCFAMGLPANAPLNTTPFAFTRGLRVDGKWDEKGGLYGSKGGYVAFCDGHVTWFDGDKPAKFLRWDGKGYANDIREAVPDSVFITCGNERTKTDYESDGELVILCNAGTGG
jgi:prepilin-type processing-associated H-X9-DG protein